MGQDPRVRQAAEHSVVLDLSQAPITEWQGKGGDRAVPVVWRLVLDPRRLH